jgi:flagella basal body P-ring formation protein FlgA
LRNLSKIKNAICGFSLGLFLFSLQTVVASQTSEFDTNLRKKIKAELSKVYPSFEIEIKGNLRWITAPSPHAVKSVTLLGGDSQGHARFFARGDNLGDSSEGTVDFSAWALGGIATKRIHPGDRVDASSFTEQKIDVAVGSAREYRGVILPLSSLISNLEATQTIFEGQYLTSTAVRKIPDVRRGDALQVEIKSGALLIRTSGIAQEASYLNRPLKILTVKGKRELIGQLMPGGVVEVKI